MGDVLALAERFWRGEVTGPDLVRATGVTEEIVPGVLFTHAFANVTALRTDAGLVLVDTGNFRTRDKTFAIAGHRAGAKRLVSALLADGIDVAYAYEPRHQPLGHAFVNSILYLDIDRKGFPYPVVPFTVNA